MTNVKTYPKLRGKIIEVYGSQNAFAKAIGKSEQTVIAKFKGKSAFSQADIIAWSNALDITKDEVGTYFFSEKL